MLCCRFDPLLLSRFGGVALTSSIPQALEDYLELLALLRPAARFVLRRRLKLGWAKKAFEAAVLEESRFEGLSLKELARALGFGTSKAFALGRLRHRELPQSCLPDPSSLPELIEAMLCLGPLSPAKLNQFLPEFKYAEIQASVGALLQEGRLLLEHGLLRVPRTPTQAQTHLFFEVLAATLDSPTTRRTFSLPRATLDHWLAQAAAPAASEEDPQDPPLQVCLSWRAP